MSDPMYLVTPLLVLVTLLAILAGLLFAAVLWQRRELREADRREQQLTDRAEDLRTTAQARLAEAESWKRQHHELERQVRRLTRERDRLRESALAARPVPSGSRSELMESGLPGEIVAAIARAPVTSEGDRGRLQRWAELEYLARPEAAGEIAREIAEGIEGDRDEELVG